MKQLTYYDSAKTEEDVHNYLNSFLLSESGLVPEAMNVIFEPEEKLIKVTVTVEQVKNDWEKAHE